MQLENNRETASAAAPGHRPTATVQRRYDLVLLDFDGTLADSFPLFQTVMEQACRRYRVVMPDAAMHERLRSMDTAQMLKAMGLRWWQVPGFVRHIRASMAPLAGQVRLFDGIAPVLQALHAHGVQLALVTSNRQDNAERILGPELVALFAQMQCSVSLMGKRRALARVIARSGVLKSRVLSVGDERRDAQATAALGGDFAGVAWGFSLPSALQELTPLPVLNSPEGLLNLILSLPNTAKP